MTIALGDIGIMGLGVMGRSLALNMADHGFRVAVYNRTDSVTRDFAMQAGPEQQVRPCYSPEEFAAALTVPRNVMIMVKAGQPVDAVIETLQDLIRPGDVVMDGGNSHFRDTMRRAERLAAEGVGFLGVGISGGEFGARTGPSIMPGGPREAYEAVRPILEAIAARADGQPCVAYLGPGAAGHYVKMVHNGIEYGLMQLLADTYALLKRILGLSNEELVEVYSSWNEAELDSYLVEITAKIFARRDDITGAGLIDLIRGEAAQLGTGVWTAQTAMDLQVPSPNVDIAVAMRNLSALDQDRRAAAVALGSLHEREHRTAQAEDAAALLTIEDVRRALFAGMIVTYAQGFAHLRTASTVLGLDLRLEDVASVWRAGCIIRSALLRDIRAAFRRQPELANLLADRDLAGTIASRREDLARTVRAAASTGVPAPGLMAALAYVDAYRADWLPFNLTQAQRDYFGAHTYRRHDQEGVFHTDWFAEEGGS